MINILLPKPRTSKSCTTWFTAAPEDRGTDPLNLRLSKVAEDKHTLGVRVTSSHHVTCFTGKLYHFRGLVPQRPSIASTNIHSLLKVLLLAATRVGTLSASRLLVSTPSSLSRRSCFLQPPVRGKSTPVGGNMSKRDNTWKISNPYLKKSKNQDPTENVHQSPAKPLFQTKSGGGANAPIDLPSSPESPPARGRALSNAGKDFKIFCDLDGVLVDFDAGVQRLFGKRPDELHSSKLWGGIHKATPPFYASLPWTSDGKQLWNAIKHLNPDILTGVPLSNKARLEKAAWCRSELGLPTNHVDMAGKKSAHEAVSGRRQEDIVNIITCWSRNKHFESGRMAVLIDDREALAEKWRDYGGIFVHHTSTPKTLSELKRHGILPAADEL